MLAVTTAIPCMILTVLPARTRGHNGKGRPEFRLRELFPNTTPIGTQRNISASMVPGTVMLPIGILITGWATEAHVHWIAADIVSVIISLLHAPSRVVVYAE